jgi:hypothetical protein
MPCVNPDGSLTESARKILDVLNAPFSPEEIAARTGLPLFRVRSAMREMLEAGVVVSADGSYARPEPSSTAQ